MKERREKERRKREKKERKRRDVYIKRVVRELRDVLNQHNPQNNHRRRK